jgi:glycine/D-amino acid oxidase-like deaminating enzyme
LPDLVVLGGGVIGCATAYSLAKRGASVTLLERGDLASEATGASAGMLAALSGEGAERGPAFAELCVQSLARYDSLIPELAETGVDVRYTRTGVLHLALTQEQANALRARFGRGSLPAGARFLEAADIQREEPDANPRARAAILTPDEAYVDPQRLTVALAEAARRWRPAPGRRPWRAGSVLTCLSGRSEARCFLWRGRGGRSVTWSGAAMPTSSREKTARHTSVPALKKRATVNRRQLRS